MVAVISCLWASSADAQTLPRGTVVDPVPCADDPAQTYALYLPSTYSPERTWSLLLAFHPAARGRLMVEKFQAAAEQYGYIVAASNNARNGPHAISAAAAQAMSTDVSRRFSIDLQRVYLTGMSGGARVAMGIALANTSIAGVVASSAGYPDSQPRDKVTFAVFGTAGTEDFNYVEMRLLDRKLSSPHFLAVFEGGHTLPPDDIALDALEWMELQAMQSGRRRRDDALVVRLLEKRRSGLQRRAAWPTPSICCARSSRTSAASSTSPPRPVDWTRCPAGQTSSRRSSASGTSTMPKTRMLGEMFQLEAQLGDDDRRGLALMTLRDRLSTLSRTGGASRPTRPSAARHGGCCGRLRQARRDACRIGSIWRCWTSTVCQGVDLRPATAPARPSPMTPDVGDCPPTDCGRSRRCTTRIPGRRHSHPDTQLEAMGCRCPWCPASGRR